MLEKDREGKKKMKKPGTSADIPIFLISPAPNSFKFPLKTNLPLEP